MSDSALQPLRETPPRETQQASIRRTKPFRLWHEAIIDDMLLHPFDTYAERAQRLGYTQSYLRLIMTSDMFKMAYRTRREQHSEFISSAIVHKASKVAEKGLDIMLEKFETQRSSIGLRAVTETTTTLLSQLGFGAQRGGPSVNLQVNTNGGPAAVAVGTPATAEQLARAREKLQAVEQSAGVSRHPPLLEGQVESKKVSHAPALGPASVPQTVRVLGRATAPASDQTEESPPETDGESSA